MTPEPDTTPELEIEDLMEGAIDGGVLDLERDTQEPAPAPPEDEGARLVAEMRECAKASARFTRAKTVLENYNWADRVAALLARKDAELRTAAAIGNAAMQRAIDIGRERDDARAELAQERERVSRLRAAVVVLRDRLFQSVTFAGAVGQDEPEAHHEDAAELTHNNCEAIRATDRYDTTDRSHEKWELEAAARLREAGKEGA